MSFVTRDPQTVHYHDGPFSIGFHLQKGVLSKIDCSLGKKEQDVPPTRVFLRGSYAKNMLSEDDLQDPSKFQNLFQSLNPTDDPSLRMKVATKWSNPEAFEVGLMLTEARCTVHVFELCNQLLNTVESSERQLSKSIVVIVNPRNLSYCETVCHTVCAFVANLFARPHRD